MSRSPLSTSDQNNSPASRATFRRSGSGRVIAHLPQYDVRVRRELAHRRFVVSMVRQALRVVTLHALDAIAIGGCGVLTGRITGIALGSDALIQLTTFVLIGLNLSGSYRPGQARRDGWRLVTGVVSAGMLAAAVPAAPVATRTWLEFLGLFALATTASLAIGRALVNVIVHQAYVRGIGLRRALIVSRASDLGPLITALNPDGKVRPAEDQIITGYVTTEKHDPAARGTLAELGAILDHDAVSEVLVATPLANEDLTQLADTCFERGVRVLVIPSAVTTAHGWAEPTQVGRLPAYHLHPVRLELPALMLKRVFDLVLAAVGLVLSAPLMLVIAALIKLESRGPILFRQRRVGVGGREFMMWKFRSMLDEAESQRDDIAHLNAYGDARLFKLRGDPRITMVGRFLRRFSLDELPQLFNVLRGDMSLVGPRPPLPSEVQHYEPHHFVRLSVVPGLTGPWQVSGRNLITDFEAVVRLERAYIESWSLRTDLKIILRTGAVVLSGKGAY